MDKMFIFCFTVIIAYMSSFSLCGQEGNAKTPLRAKKLIGITPIQDGPSQSFPIESEVKANGINPYNRLQTISKDKLKIHIESLCAKLNDLEINKSAYLDKNDVESYLAERDKYNHQLFLMTQKLNFLEGRK